MACVSLYPKCAVGKWSFIVMRKELTIIRDWLANKIAPAAETWMDWDYFLKEIIVQARTERNWDKGVLESITVLIQIRDRAYEAPYENWRKHCMLHARKTVLHMFRCFRKCLCKICYWNNVVRICFHDKLNWCWETVLRHYV